MVLCDQSKRHRHAGDGQCTWPSFRYVIGCAFVMLTGCNVGQTGGVGADETAATTEQGTTNTGTITVTSTTPKGGTGITAGDGNNAGDSNTVPGTSTAPAVLETTHFMGRFINDPNGMRFAWSGSTVSTQFYGSGVDITLDELDPQPSTGGNMYDVTLDGNATAIIVAPAGGGTYMLASGLPLALHTVSVQKRTEAKIGAVRFRGFTIVGGEVVAVMRSVDRRILMVGDSITCGYGALGKSSTCAFTAATENAAVTYGAVAAKSLGADVQFVSWSGKGVYRNNDGSFAQTIPDLIGLAVPTDPNSVYDAAAFVPDAIVINLGTNDFSATYGAPNPASFSGAYLTLLGNLRTAYPNAKVFLALGPMLTNGYPQDTTYLSDAARALESVRAAAQNPNISILTLATLSDTERGCDSHPTAAAHARMAASLTVALKKALNW